MPRYYVLSLPVAPLVLDRFEKPLIYRNIGNMEFKTPFYIVFRSFELRFAEKLKYKNDIKNATIWTMIIVVDTNIFLGACLGKGPALQVISSCLKGEHTPLMSSTLFTEYEDVLSREKLFSGSRLNTAERDELLDIFIATTKWTRVYYNWRPNLTDEADNHLIELAVAGNASHIVTRNLRDFANPQLLFPGLTICSPEKFIKESKK